MYICSHMYMYSVYKEFPRYKLSMEIKDHKLGDLEHFYITTTLQNLDTSLSVCVCVCVCACVCVCVIRVHVQIRTYLCMCVCMYTFFLMSFPNLELM